MNLLIFAKLKLSSITTVNETTPSKAEKVAATELNKKGSKQKTSLEMEPPNPDKSPKKKKSTLLPSVLESGHSFEAASLSASRELSMLLSKFAEVLSERASADTVQMKQLEGILTEAQNLESFLKEKKSHLRQTLALISDKLQG